jgi:thioredoxin reductase (NADPH)
MSTREQRGYQMFPVLDGARVETALRFASGQQGTPAWLVLSGSVDITRRDGLDHEAPVVIFSPGQFTGEVNQFADRETGFYLPGIVMVNI